MRGNSSLQLHLYVAIFLICLHFTLSDVTVNTKYGKVRGIQTPKTKVFLGVPYASPPVGKLRWKNPVEPLPWSVYNATERKPGCPQKGCLDGNPSLVCPKETSEDCLYLYIWTPLTANESTSFPVLVYLHGGNFVHMSANSVLFDGEELSYRGQIIIVSLDYRLGALGFLLTSDRKATGNYGILDQRQALKWVQENIKNFGGNPNSVTLSGQSAGAQSTVVHLMSKDSSQYYQRAIVESAPFSIPFKTEAEILFISNMLFDQLNCSTTNFDCLLQKSADDIATAQHYIRKYPSSVKLLEFFEPWVPYVDGVIVPCQPLDAFQKGIIIDKPLVIGTVTEETRIFIYDAWNKSVTALEYAEVITLTFPENFLKVLNMYPPLITSDSRDTLQVPSTDFIFTCSTRNFTQNVGLQNGGKIWNYIFDHSFSFPGWEEKTFCENHVCHGEEIPFVFHSTKLGNFTITADEEKLSDSLIRYWSNFVKTGDPNEGGSIPLSWPKYDKNSLLSRMWFTTPVNSIKGSFRENFCDFWDTLGYTTIKT